MKAINENIAQLKTITFPAFPSIEGVQQPDEDTDTQYIGPIAQEYLRKFATKTESDKTYGLYDKSGNFYIGNKPVIIVDDNVVVDGEEYQGTAGLWELIVAQKYRSCNIHRRGLRQLREADGSIQCSQNWKRSGK